MLAVVVYSYINIINASVLIPAKMTKAMILSFVLLIAGTGAFFYLTHNMLGLLNSMSWGMAVGSLLSLFYMLFAITRKLSFGFFNIDHVAILTGGFFVSLLCPIDIFWIKLAGFMVFVPLILWSFNICSFVPKEDYVYSINKFKKIFRTVFRYEKIQ